jgi:hypothetical protein
VRRVGAELLVDSGLLDAAGKTPVSRAAEARLKLEGAGGCEGQLQIPFSESVSQRKATADPSTHSSRLGAANFAQDDKGGLRVVRSRPERSLRRTFGMGQPDFTSQRVGSSAKSNRRSLDFARDDKNSCQ